MKQSFHIIIILIFCIFFGAMALYSVLLPDKTFSQLENRNLRLAPELSNHRIASGRFMTEAETYISDQIALRDQWVMLKAFGERCIGKTENNGIYFAADDTLIRHIPKPDNTVLHENIQYLNRFVSQTALPVYFALIPTSASVWQDKLPYGAPVLDEDAFIAALYNQANAAVIDIASILSEHQTEYIYYRTDHHWTSLGAFYGANAILQKFNAVPLQLAQYEETIVTTAFYGTNYSSACAWWIAPDTISTYIPEQKQKIVSNFTGKNEPGNLYVPAYLDVKNKYGYFLGGTQPLCIISSEAEGPRLLVIRDSYADCLAPFLSERFSEIHLFDLRYNHSSVQDYIKDNAIDAVLILYNLSNYITDSNQSFLVQ